MQKPLVAVLTCVLLCVSCRTELPPDEVPETSAARSSLTLISERPELAWIAQPGVRFSRGGTLITAEMPHQAAPSPALIELPTDATGFTRVTEAHSGMTIRQRLEHNRPVSAESAKGLLVFRGAFEGFDFFQRPSPTHVEDFLSFPTRPTRPRVSYEVELAQGVAGLRLVEGVLEFVDASGDPRLRAGPASLLGADSRWHDVRAEVEGCAVDRNPAAPWGRPVTAPGSATCRVIFTWADAKNLYPAVFDPSWTTTVGTMVSPRGAVQGVLLNTGLVLVPGGLSTYTTPLRSAELYNEVTGTWSATGSMSVPRVWYGLAFTSRNSPRALIAGGYSSVQPVVDSASLEWYDPESGTWSPAGNVMSPGRGHPQAVTLADGRVAIIGGQHDYGSCLDRLSSAYVYDPVTNLLAATGTMSTGRVLPSATLLPDGRVFVTGGYSSCCGTCTDLRSTEILNPNLTWTPGPSLNYVRAGHAGAVLADRTRVLIAGGHASPTSEIYNIPSNTVTTARSMGISVPLQHWAMTTLSDNRVLFAGGGFTSPSDGSAKSTLLYNPVTDVWTTDTPLIGARRVHAQVTTASGRTLVAGGGIGGDSAAATMLNTSEIFDALPNGAACAGNGLCASKLCVDGVCCNTSCTGSCDACNLASSSGTCTPVPPGASGTPACANHLACDGTAASCPAACSSDQTCESGYFCLNGTCQPKKPNGQTCGGARECQSSLCVDGVCCNTACAGSCDACNLPPTPGQCSSVPASTPGTPACSNHFVCDGSSATCPTACSSDQVCESGYFCLNGTCRPQNPNGQPCSAANQCQSGFCIDGVCCNNACGNACDACNVGGSLGTCSNVPPGTPAATCGPFLCNGVSSSCPASCTTHQQCLAPAMCINGQCQNQAPPGQPCTQAIQCQSGLCVDGVCCSTPCDGSCGSCNAPGAAGTCTALATGTPGEPVCAPYVCDGTGGECPAHCTADSQCAAGSICERGVCKAGPRGHIGWPCGCGTSSEGSAFLALILLGLLALRRPEQRS